MIASGNLNPLNMR